MKLRDIRLRLLAGDPHCRYCRQSVTAATSSLDHIIPRSRGGTNSQDNLVLVCRRCNTLKGDRLPAELTEWVANVNSSTCVYRQA